MGDDEFFGSTTLPSNVQRNPLAIHEIPQLARMLTYIAYTLHWHAAAPPQVSMPGLPSALDWSEAARSIGTCVIALHERDTRRPFVPNGGWIIETFNDDGHAFREAAMQVLLLNMFAFWTDIIYSYEYRNQDTSLSHRRKRMTHHRLAQLTPRIAVLANIPFSIPFEIRVSIFRKFVAEDRKTLHIQSHRMGGPNRTRLIVRRGRVAEDGFDKLDGVNLKHSLEIVFIDQFGNEESAAIFFIYDLSLRILW